MKKFKKIISIIILLVILFSFPFQVLGEEEIDRDEYNNTLN